MRNSGTTRMNIWIIYFFITVAYALEPLAGCTYIGETVDPVTFIHGSNIMQANAKGICISPDGKWDVPCGLNVEPIITTDITMNSYSYTKTTDYIRDGTTKVAFSAGLNLDEIGVQGSFSQSTQDYVHNLVDNSMIFVASEIEMTLYQVSTDLITMPLGESFTNYINVLTSCLKNNDMSKYDYWMAQFLNDVKYSTITTITSGAQLTQTQYVTNQYFQSTDKTVITNSASASASFAGLFTAGGSYDWGVTQQQIDTFQSKSSMTTTSAIGGPYVVGMTLQQWQNSAVQNPGILSYTLSKTSYWINPDFFPNLPAVLVTKIYNDYETAWQAYILNNTKLGCSDTLAINFQLDVTGDDGSCNLEYITGSGFGGVYMQNTFSAGGTSTNQDFPNPLTNSAQCLFGSNSDCIELVSTWSTDTATKKFCICSAPDTSDLLKPFGGFYTNTSPNPVTSSATCPASMSAITVTLANNAGNNHLIYSLCTSTSQTASYTYGGAYFIVNGICQPNIFTSECTCPEYAPYIIPLLINLQISNSAPVQSATIYTCYGSPLYHTNSNPGEYPVYQNFVYQNTNQTTNKPSHHHEKITHRTKIIIWSLSSLFIFLVFMVLMILYCKHRQRQSYEMI